jgi:predicted ATPase/DNA-binding CsgD family transcriptional regulator
MPDLPLDASTIEAIAAICARLEGLPLAIELAAARVKFLPPPVLRQRLAQRLTVLTQGGPDRPSRQQTLRATFDWSHDLLSPDEQGIFRRLAIFAGGCDLEAAEAVCLANGDIANPFLDVISSLIDKSLLLPVRSTTQTARFRLAETVHEYALESLELSGEREFIEATHASYYFSFALRAEPELDRRDQDRWLQRLDDDDQNLTAALTFLRAAQDRERAIRLTGALGWYWYVRGRLNEGLNRVEQALGYRTGSSAVAEDRKALYLGGLFAIHLDQGERARSWLEQSQDLCKLAKDTAGYALASYLLTMFFLLKGNPVAARDQAERVIASTNKSADARALAITHCLSGTLAVYLGEFTRARACFEQSAALFREADDSYMGDLALLMAGDALIAEGEKAQGQAQLEELIRNLEQRQAAWAAGYLLCACSRFALQREDSSRSRLLLGHSLTLFHRLRDPRGMARACLFLAQAALYQQDYSTAIATARQCLANARAADAVSTIISCLEELADVAVQRNKAAWAAQLWGAAARQREAADSAHLPAEPADRAHHVKQAREALGAQAFSEAWNEGHSLSLDQLLSVENVTESVVKHPDVPSQRPAGLTRRELEVLLLVAEGLSNVEIAERLVLSPGTVVSYLNLIYRKLDVSSRTAAMRYVIDHQLNESRVGSVC